MGTYEGPGGSPALGPRTYQRVRYALGRFGRHWPFSRPRDWGLTGSPRDAAIPLRPREAAPFEGSVERSFGRERPVAGGPPIVGFTGEQSYASIARRRVQTARVNNCEPRLPRCCWRFRGGGNHDCCDPRVVGVLTV